MAASLSLMQTDVYEEQGFIRLRVTDMARRIAGAISQIEYTRISQRRHGMYAFSDYLLFLV
ncbi:MAG: hypothetical protein Q9188_001119 [Gyalolechia gomerana]